MSKMLFRLEPIDFAPLDPRVLRTFSDTMLIGYMRRRACVQNTLSALAGMPQRYRKGILNGAVGVHVEIPGTPETAEIENIKRLIQEDCERMDKQEEADMAKEVEYETAAKAQPQPKGAVQ